MSVSKFAQIISLVLLITISIKAGDNQTQPQIFQLNELLPQNNMNQEKISYISDRWLAPDKGLHVIGSMIQTIGIAKSFERFGNKKRGQAAKFGAGISVCLGFGKELRDSQQAANKFSIKDLIANLTGVTFGILLVSTF